MNITRRNSLTGVAGGMIGGLPIAAQSAPSSPSLKVEIIKDVELDAGLPVQRNYLYIDGTKSFGPLSSDEMTILIGVMKKSVTPGWFSEQATVSG